MKDFGSKYNGEKTTVTRIDIEHRVIAILANELDIPPADIHSEQLLTELANMDSLTLIEAVMSIEDEFDTLLPDREIENLHTVMDLIDLCEKKNSHKA